MNIETKERFFVAKESIHVHRKSITLSLYRLGL